MHRLAWLFPLMLCSCASQRVLRIENQLLVAQNEALQAQVTELSRNLPAREDYSTEPSLAVVSAWLDRANLDHELVPGSNLIRLDYSGRNTSFQVFIQHFERGQVLFVTTSRYLTLDIARDTPSLVMLLTQLTVANYELTVGKFQLNPESGEILLSVEIPLDDGLGYHTFNVALDRVCQTADARYPSLLGAASGLGM